MDTLSAALNYVMKLKWSVIPLKPGSKLPLIPWQEFQSRYPTEMELKSWFKDTQNNIGIVTGQVSNLSVLDVDELKNHPNVTSSITVLTKNGKHLYFKFSGETNSASKIADKIDVRGEGGYVVAPRSSIDGHMYRFINPNIHLHRLPDFPRGILDAVSPNVQSTKEADWISTALSTLSEGNRNHTFTQIAGRLFRDGHVSDSIYTLLAPHAANVDFDLGELNAIVQSVSRYENRSSTSNALHSNGDKTEDLETFLQGEEKVEWLIPKIVAKSCFGLCAGLPETFKSWLLIDMAIECARGGSWLGMKAKKCRVMFLEQERFKGEVKERVRKMLLGKNLMAKDLKDNLRVQSGTSTRLDLPESFVAFKRKLDDFKPELLILDSFVTFHVCSENDRTEIQKVLERVKELRNEYGCAILCIDHEGKSVLNPELKGDTPNYGSVMGSIGKPAAAEVVLTVRKNNANSVTIYNTKNSLAQATPPIQVEIVDTENEGIRLVCNG